jgi:cellulose synthase/poly-beta-1,6-N-acetylglucosamine synthase-like glycosyltransferase
MSNGFFEYPLVSIIVPVHNAEQYLDQALSSIADQSYRPLEAVLVDDGSTDNSFQVLLSWVSRLEASNVSVKLLSTVTYADLKRPQGPGFTR